MSIRKRIRAFGIVQGVGFRPFVARIATATGIGGSVCNKGPYVEIFAEGTAAQVQDFLQKLEGEAPERSRILKVDVRAEEPTGNGEFQILPSERQKGNVFVSPDLATCPKCEKELFDPADRRYLHPFINCTACGPRLTIVDQMPYDRVRTSMGEFPMCPVCEEEYTSPETRRYHAQPVCCNACGPRLYALDPKHPEDRSVTDGDAIRLLRKTVMQGGICALKGIGGFHLVLDARNEAAVQRLRELKRRPYKALAVMCRDLATISRECEVLPEMMPVLTGPEKPILLLPKKPGGRIVEAVAPDNDKIGVMLPYAPVQMLLFDYPDGLDMTDAVVMTSANPSGAPICKEDQDVLDNLGGLCDLVISHNRKIRLRSDDSVMNWYRGEPLMIRRSRGYAPLPFFVRSESFATTGRGHAVLGAGGELKNTFCYGSGDLFYPSAYVGDLSDLRTVQALEEAIPRMGRLLDLEPEAVCCDLHPGYQSSAVAEKLATKSNLPLYRIQHHYAHILSCMAENDAEGPVIGLAFDGTGYGTDGTIWGSEFLLADYDGFTRLGSAEPFQHAGGDLASREGFRIAASILDSQGTPDETADLVDRLGICSAQELAMLRMMKARGINTVPSVSMGRIFDAASAVLGFRRCSSTEGEAAMVLQTMAERAEVLADSWMADLPAECLQPYEDAEIGLFRLRTGELLLWLAKQRAQDPSNVERNCQLAWLFHEAIATMAANGAVLARQRSGVQTVALSGGVFQNTLLLDRLQDKLEEEGFRVLVQRLVPANDGGIALGQAVYAAARMVESAKYGMESKE